MTKTAPESGFTAFGDNPIRTLDHDGLGRKAACQGLARLLADDAIDLPLVAAVLGPWGSGKTSFLNMLEDAIGDRHLRVRFDAWPFAEDKEALWRALFLAVVEGLRRDLEGRGESTDLARLDILAARLYRAVTVKDGRTLGVNWASAASLASQGGLWLAAMLMPGVELAKKTVEKIQEKLAGEDAKDIAALLTFNEANLIREQITSLEMFRAELRDMVQHRLGAGRRLFVFVDDLDRCQPEAAVKALEAIKVFLDLPHTVFVVAVDRALIELGVRVRYQSLIDTAGGTGPFRPADFLDKIIQIPFPLPPALPARLDALVATAWAGDTPLPEACMRILRTGIAANPRALKRACTHLAVAARVSQAAVEASSDGASTETLARLAKLTVLSLTWPDDYRKLTEGDVDWLLNIQDGRAESPDRAQTSVLREAAGRFTRKNLAALVCLTFAA